MLSIKNFQPTERVPRSYPFSSYNWFNYLEQNLSNPVTVERVFQEETLFKVSAMQKDTDSENITTTISIPISIMIPNI